MERRLSLVTLGVSDLARAVDFYENVIGWKKADSPDGVAFFDLNGMLFSLFPHSELAKDMRMSAQPLSNYRGLTLAHNLRSKDEVDRLFAELRAKGVTIIKQPEQVFWGGYSGYFADPDGHLWEAAFNPFWTISADGRISMASP